MSDVDLQDFSDRFNAPEAKDFVRVDRFTTFAAEYRLEGGGVTVHFYQPTDSAAPFHDPELVELMVRRLTRPPYQHYWKERFANALEQAVERVLKVQPPAVVASYTEELASWWLRCTALPGFAPEQLLERFFVEMDGLLDPELPKS